MTDYDQEFYNLTQRLPELVNPEIEGPSLLDLSQALETINETGVYLGKYISKVIAQPRGTAVPFPHELLPIIPALVDICNQMTGILHDHVCEECMECECEEDCTCEIEED